MQGLRSVLSHYDLNQTITPLAQTILRMLGAEPAAGSRRLGDAGGQDVRRATRAGDLRSGTRGEPEMLAIVQSGATILAEFTNAVARSPGFQAPAVKLIGGLFNHPDYVALYKYRLSTLLPKAPVERCAESGALGAVWLASRHVRTHLAAAPADGTLDREQLAVATTEQRNPRSANLDQLSPLELVDLFVSEEDSVAEALAACREPLAAGIELVGNALRAGGRLFYVGAGTSGRLGVLDASEIPPTFGASPELVQGIIAGGVVALHRAVEGAEDQPEAGALAVLERGVRAGDVVCGIAASGRTRSSSARWRGRASSARGRSCSPAIPRGSRARSRGTWRSICPPARNSSPARPASRPAPPRSSRSTSSPPAR